MATITEDLAPVVIDRQDYENFKMYLRKDFPLDDFLTLYMLDDHFLDVYGCNSDVDGSCKLHDLCTLQEIHAFRFQAGEDCTPYQFYDVIKRFETRLNEARKDSALCKCDPSGTAHTMIYRLTCVYGKLLKLYKSEESRKAYLSDLLDAFDPDIGLTNIRFTWNEEMRCKRDCEFDEEYDHCNLKLSFSLAFPKTTKRPKIVIDLAKAVLRNILKDQDLAGLLGTAMEDSSNKNKKRRRQLNRGDLPSP